MIWARRIRRNKKRALITGAANGLGREITLYLSGLGYEVVAVDKDERGLMSLHDQGYDTVIGVGGDFSHTAGLEALATKITARGPYDLVFLVAGINATGPFEAISRKGHEQVLVTNALAPMVLANRLAAKNAMVRGSSMMFISSLSHAVGYPGATSYAASKDAVAIYAKSIRKPFSRLGIRVCCCFPGPVRTAHAARHSPSGSKESLRMPTERMAKKNRPCGLERQGKLLSGHLCESGRFGGPVFSALDYRQDAEDDL